MYSIVATQPGDVSVLKKEKLTITNIGPNDVLIKNLSIGVNFIDIYFRKGLYPWPQKENLVLGSEAAGIVEAVGEQVNNFNIGDRVAYAQPNNSYSTHRLISKDSLVALPNDISFDQAASSMLKGLTVRYLINDSFKVKSDHTVLFHAAAGGVGIIAGQWLKKIGAKVIGTAGTDAKCKLAKDYGFQEMINYSNQNFLEVVKNLTSDQGVDVVYDSVGKDTMFNSFKSLKRHGTVVSFGQSSGPYTDLQISDLAFGSYYLTRPTLFHFYANKDWLESASSALFTMIASSKIKLDQVTEYSLENVAQAHQDIENRKTIGSVILKP